MGTEVLRPHDPLAADRLHAAPSPSSFQRRRNIRNLPNLIVDRRPYNNYNNVHKRTSFSPKPDNRRRDGSRRTSPTSSSPPPHVTILRRGESLESMSRGVVANNNNIRNGFNNKSLKSRNSKTSDDTASAGAHKKLKDRHKSNSRGYKSCDDVAVCGTRVVGPEMSPSDDVYAGSAFSLSPSPRSLPLPSFFCSNKVKSCDFAGDSETEDSATIGLRRLLRLDE